MRNIHCIPKFVSF